MEIIKNYIPFYSAISVCFILLWFIKNNSSFGRQTTRYYVLSTVSTLILCFADMGEMYFGTLTYPTIWRTIFSCLGYIFRTFTVYFLFLITIRKSKASLKVVLSVPIIINVIVNILPLFTDYVFYYDSENDFTRGPLGYTTFIVGGFYLLCLVIMVFVGLSKTNKREGLAVLVIATNAIISIALTLIFETEIYICNGIASSIAFYYLYFHTTLNNEDYLTNAFVRRKLFVDFEANEKKVTGVISLDLNNLKQINDELGHDGGDNALKTFSDVITNTINKKMKFYRVGGDEFLILCFKMSEEEIISIIDRIGKNLENASCSSAIGYAMHDKKRGIDFTIRLADRDMYSNKKDMKDKNEEN